MPRDEGRSRPSTSKPVPKFSFKARLEPPATEITAASTEEALVRKAKDTEKSNKQTERTSIAPPSHPQQLPARNRQHNESYTVDRRGDPLIRRYGSNNPREVPDYHRYGAGRVLGADGFIRFERAGTRSEFFFRGYRDKGPILSADRKTFRALTGLAGVQPIRIRHACEQDPSWTAEYLSLRTFGSAKEELGPSQSESKSYDVQDTPVYRLLEGNTGSESSDGDYRRGVKDDSDSEMQNYNDDPINIRSVYLGRKVKEEPSDMQAWHELVDHQDVLLRHAARDARHPSLAEIKSFADVKLSLLEKALKHAESPAQRELVQLKLMAEGIKIWDRNTAIRRWEELMKTYPRSQGLWQAQIVYRQADISVFRYDDIKKRYVDRIKYLQNAIFVSDSSTAQIGACRDLINTFLHATVLVSDAGFMELACSAWQAVLELNFCRPADGSSQESFADFQAFWDSETPRFGEAGSRGWATFTKDPSQHDPPEPTRFEARPPLPARDAYMAWAAMEVLKTRQAATAARTLDEGAEDDPFRVVLFADIKELLFHIPSSMLSEVKTILINAMLVFCGLPTAFDLDHPYTPITGWSQRRATGSSLAVDRTSIPEVDRSDGNDQRYPDFKQHFQSFARTPEVISGHSNWFNGFETAKDSALNARQVWAAGILKQLILQCGDTHLAPYYLALNGALAGADDKKTAKALLKQNPTNIELYLGYSSREHAKGDSMSAANIAKAALNLPGISEVDRIRLGTWLVWLKLENGSRNDAAADIMSMALSLTGDTSSLVQEDDFSQAQKAAQTIMARRDYSLSAGNLRHAAVFSETLMLLEYLTFQSGGEPTSAQQGDIWSALRSIHAFSEELIRRGSAEHATHETLLQSAAKLLYFHASHGPCRLGLLREHLSKSMDYFPRNTIFQTLYAWRETRLSIDDRVRSKLNDIVSQPRLDCLGTRAFMIQYEARAGNINSTAAAFEHALDNSDECKHHPQVWIAYIRYCHQHGSLRGKAKSVFHRALQRCPSSKDVYMEAFITLVSELDSSELKSVYNTMAEKGLRIHTEMEDFVQEWQAQQREKRQKR